MLLLPRRDLVASPQWQELLRARAGGYAESRRRELAHQVADNFKVTPAAVHLRFSELLAVEAPGNVLPLRPPLKEGRHGRQFASR